MPYSHKAAAKARGQAGTRGQRGRRDRTVYVDARDHGRPSSAVVGDGDGYGDAAGECAHLCPASPPLTSLSDSNEELESSNDDDEEEDQVDQSPRKRLPVAMWVSAVALEHVITSRLRRLRTSITAIPNDAVGKSSLD